MQQFLPLARNTLLIFAALCFFTVLFLSNEVDVLDSKLTERTGIVGPLKVEVPNSIYEITVRHAVPLNHSAYIETELLDVNKEYLFSFGNEVWAESGYDEGYYEEKNYDFDFTFTVTNPGEYYLKLTSGDTSRTFYPITVKIGQEYGSVIGFSWLIVISLIAVIIIHIFED